MFRRTFFATVLAGMLLAYVDVRSVDAIPAFARQYDMQCNGCHTRPPRLNRFGEQFHMMGFQIPSASRPDGLVGNLKDDGVAKTLLDTLALRVQGGLFEYSTSPRETERKFEPPHEVELFLSRAILPDLSFFAEFEYEPNAVEFERDRGYFTRTNKFGLGKEAFFMLNFGRLIGALGAPTMQMGGQTMVGRHGGFTMHGPMLMAGKIDPNTNFSYPTNRQLIEETELEVEREAGRIWAQSIVCPSSRTRSPRSSSGSSRIIASASRCWSPIRSCTTRPEHRARTSTRCLTTCSSARWGS